MRRRCSHLLMLTVFMMLLGGVRALAAPPIPPAPTQWVTDTAGFMSDSARSTLNAKLEAYEQTSKHQVLVWISKSTGDDSLEDWAVRSFQAWKVGRKGLDDGLVLFVFSDDHTVRIEVGYGLEGVATDSATSRVLRETILPKIKAGDHDGAIVGGVDKILALLSPGAASSAAAVAPGAGFGGNAPPAQPMPWYEVLILVLLAVAVLWFAIRHPVFAYFLLSMIGRNSGGGGGGGGFSSGGGRSGGGGASGKW